MRELMTFKDFGGGLLLDSQVENMPSNRTAYAMNMRAQNGVLTGILGSGGDTANLSTFLTKVYAAQYVEGTGASDQYMVLVGLEGVIAIPAGQPSAQAIMNSYAIGTVATGWLLSATPPSTAPKMVVSNGFLYIGGGSSLFRWKIGSQLVADKTSWAAGVSSGPPANSLPLASYGGRLWMRDPTKPMRLHYSAVEDQTNGFVNFSNCWPGNLVDLPTINQVGGETAHTAIGTPDGLAVFTNRSVRLVYDTDNGFNQVVDPENGAYEGSVIQVGDAIFGMNQKGIFRTTGRLPLEYVTDGVVQSWFVANNINLNEGVTAAVYDGSYWVTFVPLTGHPDGSLGTNRLTFEFNLTTGAIHWHGDPMNARWMMPVPRTSSSPRKLLGIRSTAQGTGVGWPSTTLANLLHSQMGVNDIAKCYYTIPLKPPVAGAGDDHIARIQRIAIYGRDPQISGLNGFQNQASTVGDVGRFLDEFQPDNWFRLTEAAPGPYADVGVSRGAGQVLTAANGAGAVGVTAVAGGVLNDADKGAQMTTAGTALVGPSGRSVDSSATTTYSYGGLFRRATDTGGMELLFTAGVSTNGRRGTNLGTAQGAGTGYVDRWSMFGVVAGGTMTSQSGTRNGTYGATAASTAGQDVYFASADGLNVGASATGGASIPFAASMNPATAFVLEMYVINADANKALYDCMSGNTGFRLGTNASNRFTATFGTGAATVTLTAPSGIVMTKPHQVAFVNDTVNNRRALYVDGVMVASDASAFAANTVAISRIGATVAGTTPTAAQIASMALFTSVVDAEILSRAAIARYGANRGLMLAINENDKLELFVGNGDKASTYQVAVTSPTTISTGTTQADFHAWTISVDDAAQTVTLHFDLKTVIQLTNQAVTRVTSKVVYGSWWGSPYYTVTTQPGWSNDFVFDELWSMTRAASLDDHIRFDVLRRLSAASQAAGAGWGTEAGFAGRQIHLRMIDLLDPNWSGPTFTLRWKRGYWTVMPTPTYPTDKGFARISGFRGHSLALQVMGYSGMRIEQVDVEVMRSNRRHP